MFNYKERGGFQTKDIAKGWHVLGWIWIYFLYYKERGGFQTKDIAKGWHVLGWIWIYFLPIGADNERVLPKELVRHNNT